MRSRFDPEIVTAGLVTSGQQWSDVEFHPAIGSTNDRAKELAADPGRPWRVVLTDHQTGGRGRLGRTWVVPDRASIAVSALVPIADPATAGWVPLLAGLALDRAVAETTREAGTPLHPTLKWPNDVLMTDDGNRKVSGILCELVPLGAGHAVVVGTGVNVHQTRAELPVESATSLEICGAAVGRERLVVTYLRHLADLLLPISTGTHATRTEALEAGRAAYVHACSTIGAQVRVHLPSGEIAEGRATGIDRSGALVVDTAWGPRTFAAGDVVHVRPALGRLA
jgi:BirA family biotin operon repressor/biotin-[acetyl-CoA-carboxylase] ligase